MFRGELLAVYGPLDDGPGCSPLVDALMRPRQRPRGRARRGRARWPSAPSTASTSATARDRRRPRGGPRARAHRHGRHVRPPSAGRGRPGPPAAPPDPARRSKRSSSRARRRRARRAAFDRRWPTMPRRRLRGDVLAGGLSAAVVASARTSPSAPAALGTPATLVAAARELGFETIVVPLLSRTAGRSAPRASAGCCTTAAGRGARHPRPAAAPRRRRSCTATSAAARSACRPPTSTSRPARSSRAAASTPRAPGCTAAGTGRPSTSATTRPSSHRRRDGVRAHRGVPARLRRRRLRQPRSVVDFLAKIRDEQTLRQRRRARGADARRHPRARRP